MRNLRRSLPSVIVSILAAVTLAACGGGGGGIGPIDPPGPTDPADPPSAAGQFAISGIDLIPPDMLKLTKEQMQGMWVLAEIDPAHGNFVALVACQSYAVDSPQCGPGDYTKRTLNADGTVSVQVGDVPFTELLTLRWEGKYHPPGSIWRRREATRMGAKIVTSTDGSANVFNAHFRDSNPPYLVVQSAGNYSLDFSWLHTSEGVVPRHKLAVRNAVAANKLLFVAGYERDADGNYVRHWESSGCKDSELVGGCLWTQYEFPGVFRGTSLSAPQVSGALASVLAVFPDTTPEDLAKFAKASAKRSGEGIEVLRV